MSTKETINPAEAPVLEKTKSLGIKKIEGQEFYIVGVNHTRGQPTKFSEASKGEDGKVDYYTIRVETPVELEYKDEGKIPIDTFFINSIAYQQIERIPNAIERLNNGLTRLGPCKSVLRDSNKTDGYNYRCLAFESDPDY